MNCFLWTGTVDALEKEQREVANGRAVPEPDQTIEILMSELDPAVMDIFTRANSADAGQATKVIQINKLLICILL